MNCSNHRTKWLLKHRSKKPAKAHQHREKQNPRARKRPSKVLLRLSRRPLLMKMPEAKRRIRKSDLLPKFFHGSAALLNQRLHQSRKENRATDNATGGVVGVITGATKNGKDAASRALTAKPKNPANRVRPKPRHATKIRNHASPENPVNHAVNAASRARNARIN